MYQHVQFKESKTLAIDYAPWECESCITDDVMRDKKITLKLLGCHVPVLGTL